MCEINRIWKAFPLKCASNPRLHARLWGQMTEWSIGFQVDERLVSDSALAASPAGKRRKERESGGLWGGQSSVYRLLMGLETGRKTGNKGVKLSDA